MIIPPLPQDENDLLERVEIIEKKLGITKNKILYKKSNIFEDKYIITNMNVHQHHGQIRNFSTDITLFDENNINGLKIHTCLNKTEVKLMFNLESINYVTFEEYFDNKISMILHDDTKVIYKCLILRENIKFL